MELKEKDNVWLFFYRFWTGYEKDLPTNICPLFWKGLMGMLVFVLSPAYLIFLFIVWCVRKGEDNLLTIRCNITDGTGWLVMGVNALLIILYTVLTAWGAMLIYSDNFPWHVWLWTWILPSIGVCIAVAAITWASDKDWSRSPKKTVEPKKSSVIKEGLKNWYERNCTLINWK